MSVKATTTVSIDAAIDVRPQLVETQHNAILSKSRVLTATRGG